MSSRDFHRLVGQTFQGCRVEQLLSRGQVSVVYRARQLRTHRPAALTLFLIPALLSLPISASATGKWIGQQIRERFVRDGPTLLATQHPNLLPVYGYGEWEGLPFLITAYRTQGSLTTRMRQRGALTLTDLLPVLEQVTAGFEAAHRQGLVHGMLTPSHLLVSADRPLEIAGLGLLRLLEQRELPAYEARAESLTLTGTHLVSPRYLAPEYLQGSPVDIRSDVYGLGVVLTELLAGRTTPEEKSPLDLLMHLPQQLPEVLEEVLLQALDPEPTQRFRRVGDFFTAWARAVEQGEETRIPWSTPDPTVEKVVFPARTARRREVVASREREHGSPPRAHRRQVTAWLVGGMVIGGVVSAGIALQPFLAGGSPKPAAPTHSVIGTTQLAPNSALLFNQPGVREHRQSVLIHLPTGDFVAYKQGCTHSGVLVNYDPKTHLLVCPAHGAIFDPARAGRVVAGPTSIPLPQLSIHVSGDGTITLL